MLCVYRHLTHHPKDTDISEEDGSHKQLPRSSTVHVDVTQAQQVTVEIVDGNFVFVNNKNTIAIADNTDAITSASTVL